MVILCFFAKIKSKSVCNANILGRISKNSIQQWNYRDIRRICGSLSVIGDIDDFYTLREEVQQTMDQIMFLKCFYLNIIEEEYQFHLRLYLDTEC